MAARRVILAIPFILLQILWIAVLTRWLSRWAALINVLLSLAAIVIVLYIITKQEEDAYKILWLLIILPFPLPGALLYLLVGNRRTGKPLRKKLEKAALPPITTEPQALEALAQEAPRMAQTFRYVSEITGFPVLKNQQAEYYPLGDALFPEMLKALESAERFIFVEYFIIQKGVMWDSMVEIMARKAAQGVDVRVMYDDMGSLSTFPLSGVRELRSKGIRCAPFNPLVFVKGTLNYRDHRKMLIVDGRVAFGGGINLADEYINRVERHGHWKDIGFRLTGETVGSYTRMFVQFWNAFTNEPVPETLLQTPAGAEETPDDGYVLSYFDSPLRAKAASNELYIDLLSQAKEYAWFFSPYLMPGEALLDALIRAARRGVDVRLMLPGIPDKKIVFRMAKSYYSVLLEAGVKIYEYTPGFVHAKGCVMDGVVGAVGTVNLDYRSLFLHFENNSLFYGASILQQLRADFSETLKKCREVTLNDLPRTFGRWLVDGVLRIFTPLC